MSFSILDIPVIFGLSIEVYFLLLIIAVPTFFIWRGILKKRFKTDRSRKIATWAATLFMTPILYVTLVLLFVFGLPFEPRKDFDRKSWLTDREGRFQMARDIIKSRMLIGKDTSQIKMLLGEPSWGRNTTNGWTYEMGHSGSGFGIDFHYLTLTFGSDGNVTSVERKKVQD